jgi:hypothetical protein
MTCSEASIAFWAKPLLLSDRDVGIQSRCQRIARYVAEYVVCT